MAHSRTARRAGAVLLLAAALVWPAYGASADPTAPVPAPSDPTPTPAPPSPSPSPSPTPAKPRPAVTPTPAAAVLPARSGAGKRVVWSKSRNRVWLVAHGRTVVRTYTVTDLDWKTPVGTYRVRSKSRVSSSFSHGRRWRLDYMTRFYIRPGQHTWIGFHGIPVDRRGRLIQPLSSVGTKGYASAGCVRQRTGDAKALWTFAPVGTKVVVVP